MINFVQLPAATPKPCNDCPWRRKSLAGWLGPMNAQQWVDLAHSEQPIACHQTIPEHFDEDPRSSEAKWEETPNLRQCKGAAIFRVNICKSQRNPTDAENNSEGDRVSIFSWDNEFIEHHTRGRL